jgi:hypothetical protein
MGRAVLFLYSATLERTLVWTVLMLALVGWLSFSAYVPDASGATCSGENVYPSQDLSNVAKKYPAGTTFCIHDGTYKISSPVLVQSGDVFWGVYSDSSRPHVTTTTYHVFYAGQDPASAASWATIRSLTISGAVGNDQCQPNCGRGIGGGKNLTVENVRAMENMNQGIGGALPGLVVRNSIIDHNGSATFSSSIDTNSSAGVKSANSMTVINSDVHHNWWNGVWCDEECNALTVQDSKITDNGKSGIHYEISTGPTAITGNTIQRNGWNDTVPNKRAGLLVVDSTNADVYGNTFGDNFQNIGVQVADYKNREPAVSNVSTHDNTMNGDTLKGCVLSGVSCFGNN